MPTRVTVDIVEPKTAEQKPQAAPEDVPELPAPQQAEASPQPLPPHVQRAIAAHRKGAAYKAAFIHPELAKDLEKFYGPSGHVIVHSEDEHGPLGHSLPDEQQPEQING